MIGLLLLGAVVFGFLTLGPIMRLFDDTGDSTDATYVVVAAMFGIPAIVFLAAAVWLITRRH